MKIIEVRDGFIKFEADESIYLSSFIKVDGKDKSYLAQVIQQKENISFAKILFVLLNGELLNYDKTLPSVDSDIVDCTSDILKVSLSYKQPVVMGKTADNKHNITIDLSAFNKKTIITLDEADNNNTIIQNLSKQFNNLGKKTVIIDTLGIIKANKAVAGIDFKLPLDKNSLKFMYEDCLNDATSDSKSTIAEIFNDLAEYSESVPFVPFRTLKTIVDEMVEKSHVFKLLVLKNKLAKFDKLNYFATTQDEVNKLSQILNSNCSILDLSRLDNLFLNRYLSYIYENLNGRNDVMVILELSNSVSKKSLKQTLTSELPTVFATHSRFNYLNDIKNFFDNFVIVPSISNNQIFRIYATFLKSIKNDSFIIVGEATNYIPFVSRIQLIENVEKYDSEIIKENNNENSPTQEFDIDIEDEIPDQDMQEEGTFENEFHEQNIKKEESFEDEILAAQESDNEVMNAIDAKSNATIAEVTENLEIPENIEMFSNEENEDETTEHSSNNEEEEELDTISQNTDEMLIAETSEDKTELQTQYNENIEIETNSFDEYNQVTELGISNEFEDNTEFKKLEEENEDVISEASDMAINEPVAEEYPIMPEEPLQLEANDTQFIETDDNENLSMEEPVDSVQEVEEISLNDVDISLIENTNESEYIEEENIPEVHTEISENEEYTQIDISGDISTEVNEVSDINNDKLDFEDIVELDPSEADDNDIIVDLEDNFAESVNEDSEEQIVKDVDKVFTTMKDEDDISDSDLDFIDELNSDEDTLLENVSNDEAILEELAGTDDNGILQEEHDETTDEEIKDYEPEILERRDSSTTMVPVYDADIPQEDLVESDPIEQGDSVIHAKYGAGVVEKMIKYGNKTLYSINFENIGRRLLDPTLTEIKKQA